MAVAVAESYLACSPRPSTSFSGAIKLQRASVWGLSVSGSWIMMPLILGLVLAVLILSAISVLLRA